MWNAINSAEVNDLLWEAWCLLWYLFNIETFIILAYESKLCGLVIFAFLMISARQKKMPFFVFVFTLVDKETFCVVLLLASDRLEICLVDFCTAQELLPTSLVWLYSKQQCGYLEFQPEKKYRTSKSCWRTTHKHREFTIWSYKGMSAFSFFSPLCFLKERERIKQDIFPCFFDLKHSRK